MFTIEFHAAEGGQDAEMFATDLARSVGKYADMTFNMNGRVATLTRECL